jgi:hypothetical protein
MRTAQGAIAQEIRPVSGRLDWVYTVLEAPHRAGEPQEPKALLAGLGVAWVAPGWDPSPRLTLWVCVANYTMTPQVVDRRMAVLLYLAAVVVQLPLSCAKQIRSWY